MCFATTTVNPLLHSYTVNLTFQIKQLPEGHCRENLRFSRCFTEASGGRLQFSRLIAVSCRQCHSVRQRSAFADTRSPDILAGLFLAVFLVEVILAALPRTHIVSRRFNEHPGHPQDYRNPPQKRGFGCLSVLGLIILTIAITIGGTLWAINSNLFSRNFKPVELNANEEATLSQKLDALGSLDSDVATEGKTLFNIDDDVAVEAGNTDDMQPEVYSEDAGKRRIELTERELNALLAKNTDLAEQLVIDLSDNLASVKLLVNLDPDFPFLGGKTLKVSSGTELSFSGDRPVVVMKGVSVWGIPIPNAWLGGLKNIDLVREFGDGDGFWKAFADGIEDIRIDDGKLKIQLAE